MRRFALALVLLAGCSTDNVPAPPTPAVEVVKAEADLVAAHNDTRKANNLPLFRVSPQLTAAAVAHSNDMAAKSFMSHTGSDRSSPATRIARTGYRARAGAENVAAGYTTVQAVMKGWLQSRGHRKNIMGDYVDIGVAVRISQKGTPYWTTVFGVSQ